MDGVLVLVAGALVVTDRVCDTVLLADELSDWLRVTVWLADELPDRLPVTDRVLVTLQAAPVKAAMQSQEQPSRGNSQM
jgi:hypothetical protein